MGSNLFIYSETSFLFVLLDFMLFFSGEIKGKQYNLMYMTIFIIVLIIYFCLFGNYVIFKIIIWLCQMYPVTCETDAYVKNQDCN